MSAPFGSDTTSGAVRVVADADGADAAVCLPPNATSWRSPTLSPGRHQIVVQLVTKDEGPLFADPATARSVGYDPSKPSEQPHPPLQRLTLHVTSFRIAAPTASTLGAGALLLQGAGEGGGTLPAPVVLGAGGWPTHLSNGVITTGWSGESFTLVAPVNRSLA